MAARYDITVARNEIWGSGFRLCDGEGNPYDITGLTLQGQVKSKLDNTAVIANFLFAVADAANGIFSASLDASEGSVLNAYGSPIQIDNLRYDIRIVNSDGAKQRIVYGTVVLQRGVTQP